MWTAQPDKEAELQYKNGLELKSSEPLQAKVVFEKLSSSGYKPAMYQLGECYFYGEGVEVSKQIAAQWYQRASAEPNPHPKAVYDLGLCYVKGWGVEEQHDTARALFARAWELGVTEAAGQLAYHALDFETQLKWLWIGEKVDNPLSLYFLGMYHENGEHGLPRSTESAFQYYMRAAKQDHFKSLWKLLTTRCLGIGSDKQFEWIVEKCYKLAETDEDMQAELGEAYHNGNGLEQDTDKAMYWLNKAIENGSVSAMKYLGDYYRQLSYSFSDSWDNETRSLHYYLLAAQNGDADSMWRVGNIYSGASHALHLSGERSPSYDLDKAAHWYEQSAEHESSLGAFETGRVYSKGLGRPVDRQKAFKYYYFAFRRNLTAAFLPVADCLMNGEGIEASCEDALEVLFMLQERLDESDPAKKDRFAQELRGEIHYRFGLLHEIGEGLEKSLEQAFQQYVVAAEYGHHAAEGEAKKFKKGLFGWKKVN